MLLTSALNKKWILLLVVLLSCCYLTIITTSNRENVFFSGDGGVKSLVVKQVGAGRGFKFLRLDQPVWVQDIWSAGFFPLRKPFVYPSSAGYLFSFPPLYQIANAVLYRQWGFRAFYLLPFLSALLLWLVSASLLLRLGLGSGRTALLLAMLVFGTPLTVYGAIYWEHMTAVLFLFGGVWMITDPRPGIVGGILAGLFCGVAVWLRPEALIMDFLYALAVLALFSRRRYIAYGAFIISLGVPIVGFLAFNKLVYGSLLGVHSYQVLQEHSFAFKIAKAFFECLLINWTGFIYFPFVALLIPAIYLVWKGLWSPERPVLMLLLVAGCFCILASLMMPNSGGRQWGARYLLPVLPILLVAGGLVLQELPRGEWKRRPGWMRGVLVAGIGYCLILNGVVGGFSFMRSNADRVKPAYDFAAQQGEGVILVNSENIPMELASLFDKRYFFLAPTDSSLRRLLPLLKQRGVKDCLYISEDYRNPGLNNVLNSDTSLLRKGNYYFAKYMIP
jgi:hypothetical protein